MATDLLCRICIINSHPSAWDRPQRFRCCIHVYICITDMKMEICGQNNLLCCDLTNTNIAHPSWCYYLIPVPNYCNIQNWYLNSHFTNRFLFLDIVKNELGNNCWLEAKRQYLLLIQWWLIIWINMKCFKRANICDISILEDDIQL